jgi:hypothetical protein
MARAGARDDASGRAGDGGRGGVDSGSISVAPDKLERIGGLNTRAVVLAHL